MYVLKLEEALQSIDGCEEVMMAFWDEARPEDSEKVVIPWALTDKTYKLGDEEIPNPLRSFVFNRAITDFIGNDVVNYSKPKGYETVRYPLSGLVGTAADKAKTDRHNAKFPDYEENVKTLNANVAAWLDAEIVVDKKPIPTGVRKKYHDCLDAPNYTLFSNTSSAAQWNNDHDPKPPIVPIESPHNSIHLAVGGYDGPVSTAHRSPARTATWVRTTRPGSIRSSSFTTASSIGCSGCGRRSTASPTISI